MGSIASKHQWWKKANEAYWSFPDDTIDSPRRLAALLLSVVDSGVLDTPALAQFINQHLMPDIALCYGDECPVKSNCWRHVAPHDHFAQAFVAPPLTEKGCDYFWPVKESDD